MSLKGKYALITGSSRGIGRAIALKLAECGAKIGVHYYKNIDAANDTLAKVRERRSDGFIVQADVNRTDDIRGMMDHVKSEFGKLDIFVSNARPEIPEFYKPPMEIRVEEWQQAINSQATAFLLGAQLVAPLMGRGGRIIAITHSPGARSGSWQPWVGMGSAKAAMESLVRYFAVALARRGITVNSLSPASSSVQLTWSMAVYWLVSHLRRSKRLNPGMKSDGVPRGELGPRRTSRMQRCSSAWRNRVG